MEVALRLRLPSALCTVRAPLRHVSAKGCEPCVWAYAWALCFHRDWSESLFAAAGPKDHNLQISEDQVYGLRFCWVGL